MSTSTNVPGAGSESGCASSANFRNTDARRVLGARHRGDARHAGLPARHLSEDTSRTADHRIQILQVSQLDRHRYLQRLGPVHDAQARRRPVDLVRRPHQLAHLDVRGRHPAVVRQGDIRALQAQLGQLQVGLRPHEPRFGLRNRGQAADRFGRLDARVVALECPDVLFRPGPLDPHLGVCLPYGHFRRFHL